MLTLDKLLSLYEPKEYCNYRNNNQDMDQSTDAVNKKSNGPSNDQYDSYDLK